MLSLPPLTTLAPQWLAPRHGAYQGANPGLSVRLDTSPTIIDLARLELAGSVGTHEVSRLAAGMPVQVTLVDGP